MSFSNLLIFFIFIIISFSSQQEINYSISSSSITIDYCNNSEGILLFHINGKISPNPYCNMKFDLSVLKPSSTEAECALFDDIDNRINCTLYTDSSNIRELQIKKQFIKLNTYRVSIDLLNFPNNTININCNTLYINKIDIIKSFLFFILYIFM